MKTEEFLDIVKEYGTIAGEKVMEYGTAAGKRAAKAKAYVEHYGVAESTRKVAERCITWENYDELRLEEIATDAQLELQRTNPIKDAPKISIIVPAWNPKELSFIQMLESVKNQTYENWELCIADASDHPMEDVVGTVFGAELEARVHYVALDTNGGLSANTNAALELATGTYVAFLDHDDVIEPNALYEVAQKLCAGADLVYTDEDKVSETLDKYMRPFRKPDFNETLLYATNYICHFCVIKKQLVDDLGGLREEFDGAQDYDLILRTIQYMREENAAVEKRIAHIAKVLYHWRQGETSTSADAFQKEYAYAAGQRALEETLDTRRLCKDTTGYGNMKLRVKEDRNLGYYRILPGEPISMNYSLVSNARENAPESVDYVMILPEYMEVTSGDVAQLISRACICGADLVVPKQIKGGKLLYHGVARAGKGHTPVLNGQPAWYHGPYQIVVTSMDVDVAPCEGILIRKNLLDSLAKNVSKHVNRKAEWSKNLKMVYEPNVTITVK